MRRRPHLAFPRAGRRRAARRTHDGPGRCRPGGVRRRFSPDAPGTRDVGRAAQVGSAGADHGGARARRHGAGESGSRLATRPQRSSARLAAGRPPAAGRRRDGANGRVQRPPPVSPRALARRRGSAAHRVVRTRGRLWLASRPDQVMWMESAGGGLRVASAGKWLAAMTAPEAANVDAERRLFAELQWEYRFGDRHTAMTVLVCGAEPPDLLDALHAALLTDAEMAHPREWGGYPDPFGDWHEDPCDESPPAAEGVASDADRRES
ncbi:GTP-binding protein [Mycobacterium sp. pR1184]|uniref:GTP-binding protein n=1 Tax=Mycobacterium sp. pR1184 TaxID=3238981 RepID=UPI00351AD9CE